MYCLQACVCVDTFQPRNFTGWCSEGVKHSTNVNIIIRPIHQQPRTIKSFDGSQKIKNGKNKITDGIAN